MGFENAVYLEVTDPFDNRRLVGHATLVKLDRHGSDMTGLLVPVTGGAFAADGNDDVFKKRQIVGRQEACCPVETAFRHAILPCCPEVESVKRQDMTRRHVLI